jgi:GNAT superfamily N-acetyltransferase
MRRRGAVGEDGAVSDLTVVEVSGADPRAARLAHELHVEMSGRYGEPDATGPHPVADGARWLLVLDGDGTALACGAVAPLPAAYDPSAVGVGEIKRLFVAPEARGRGLGADLHDRLVALARQEGFSELRLETGTVQHEALGLYESRGWRPIPSYGQYAHDARTRCFALDLTR